MASRSHHREPARLCPVPGSTRLDGMREMVTPQRVRAVLGVLVAAGVAVVYGTAGALIGPTRPTPPVAEATVTTWLAESLAPPDPRSATPARVAAFFAHLRP